MRHYVVRWDKSFQQVLKINETNVFKFIPDFLSLKPTTIEFPFKLYQWKYISQGTYTYTRRIKVALSKKERIYILVNYFIK